MQCLEIARSHTGGVKNVSEGGFNAYPYLKKKSKMHINDGKVTIISVSVLTQVQHQNKNHARHNHQQSNDSNRRTVRQTSDTSSILASCV